MKQENSHMAETPKNKRGKIALIAGGVGAIVLVAGYFIVQSQIADNAEAEIASFLRNNQLDRAVRYRDLDASLFGQSVTLHNVRMNLGETEGTVEALTISNYDLDERSGHLRSINLFLKGADFPIEANRPTLFQRRSTPPPFLIGVNAVRGDVGIEYQYDNVSGDLNTLVNFSLPDLLEGDLQIDVGGMHLPPMDRLTSRDFSAMGKMLQDARTANLQAMSLTLTDLGLEDTIAEYLSVKNGMALDGASYRDQLLRVLENEIEENPPRSPFENHMADIAQSVIGTSGGTVSVSYEPEYPTTFEDMSAVTFGLMFGGFGLRTFQNNDILDDLFDREVLQVEFDS
tara:strand:+ start:3269 stop:4297 length:1029 start_codon:yes stop_codon:yes gene_type:complete